jgi:hypothetical protein
MGYAVLYVAFGIVALWLLGEALLQYKARLRWRALAFAGFLGVAGGVALRDVIVIVLGAIAFGTGQSFVTLSYKRGFSTGWALGGRPGSSRRRKGAGPRVTEPVLAVTPVEEESYPTAAAGYDLPAPEGDQLQAGPGDAVYQPAPMHDESGEYPLYDSQSTYTPDPYTSGGYEGYGAQGYGDWNAEPQPAAASASYEGGYDGAAYGTGGSNGAGGYEQQQPQQQPGWGEPNYGYQQAPYQEQPAAAAGGYDGYGGGQDAGDWQSQQPYPQPPQSPPAADPYGSYGYDQQPYIPQQQQQPPYEQQQPQRGEPAAEYADPYDPYRY